jgi:hypothetical protein
MYYFWNLRKINSLTIVGKGRSGSGGWNPSWVLPLSPAMPSVCSVSSGLGAMEVWRTIASRKQEGSCSLLSLFFGVFFGMVRQRLHLEIRIKSSTSYPRSGDASSGDGGHVESCARRISWDSVGFRVRWRGFTSVSFDLRLLLLVVL